RRAACRRATRALASRLPARLEPRLRPAHRAQPEVSHQPAAPVRSLAPVPPALLRIRAPLPQAAPRPAAARLLSRAAALALLAPGPRLVQLRPLLPAPRRTRAPLLPRRALLLPTRAPLLPARARVRPPIRMRPLRELRPHQPSRVRLQESSRKRLHH